MVTLEGFWLNRSGPPGVLGFAYGDHYAWNCNAEVKLHWARFPYRLRLVESGTIRGSSRCAVPRIVSSVRGFSRLVHGSNLGRVLVADKDAKFHFNDDCKRAFELLMFKLATTPINTAPNWSIPFELMCDASDVAVGAIFGEHINNNFHLVYYARNTINSALVNYTVTEIELLAMLFAIEKFHPNLMGAKMIVHMDHAALCYLMTKKDSKDRLM
ncbi:PREDICTED: uncharacterized protein LOC109238706 [Nicotiana attenuata]|uniref:uncharacterized protein LOC109238706 n=1 Tax=Nicotiana attenuata TaxID=49451 RepID=UPI0009048E3C|nr:PREDICTED: uncharacterized protein LOC109238706 [Nicotiana attenuata]